MTLQILLELWRKVKMKLADHLIYLDITNTCNLNCAFCMYKDKRKLKKSELNLNMKARKNISNLINHLDTSHIIISAEGEPFNNEKTMIDILSLSNGSNYFQIITNGGWIDDGFEKKMLFFNNLASSRNDKYSLRLSIDSFHLEKMSKEKYAIFFKHAQNASKKFTNISFAIRSILDDKEMIREFISNILHDLNISFNLKTKSELDDELIFDEGNVNINYKNLVFPSLVGIRKPLSIYEYISLLEDKYSKKFTLGNLAAIKANKGLDLTIKPNGDVFFYGTEIESFGNIFYDNLGIDYFIEKLNSNIIIKTLYSSHFLRFLSQISKNPSIEKKILEVNNPYWIIKTLFPRYKEEIIGALKLK
ncbi:MAG: hypothetical protein ABIE94_06060 [archaeon]